MNHNRKLRWRWIVMGLLGGMLLLPLGACVSAPSPEVLTKLQVEHVTVPATLLTVPEEPPVPAGRMQSSAADYIVRLKINDDECHLDVGAIAASQK